MDRRRRPRTPLLTALLLVSLAAAAAATLSQGCDGGERRALLRSIKPLFVGGEFGYGDAWNESTDCCGWEGVVCGGGGGGHRVVSLSLVQAGIAGAVDGAAFAAFTALQELDLSWNRISAFSLPSAGGAIPPPLGFLRQLKSLNLSHNQLVGPIPETFMYMQDMESLDLSYNHLNGSLPMQLANLSFLCSFNVAYNNLSGEIPFQQQLGTFDESAFEGNDNLCGEIINKNCSSVLHQNQGVFDAIDTSLVFWSYVFGCFALGFWGTVALLIWDEVCRRRLCDLMDALMFKLGWEFVP